MTKYHNRKLKEYAIYRGEEMIDVLELNAKQAREYKEDHPDLIVEEIPDDDPSDFCSSEFDDILEENGYYN